MVDALAFLARHEKDREPVRAFLIGYLNHPREELRVSAAKGLGTLLDPKSLAVLQPLAATSKVYIDPVRDAAERSIQSLEAEQTKPQELKDVWSKLQDLQKKTEEMRSSWIRRGRSSLEIHVPQAFSLSRLEVSEAGGCPGFFLVIGGMACYQWRAVICSLERRVKDTPLKTSERRNVRMDSTETGAARSSSWFSEGAATVWLCAVAVLPASVVVRLPLRHFGASPPWFPRWLPWFSPPPPRFGPFRA